MIYGTYKDRWDKKFPDVIVYPFNKEEVIVEYSNGMCNSLYIETVLKNYYPAIDYTSFFEAL